jgi:N-methylhydantoinase A/oxoprolinase/acetone carboxylase beta subunit
MGFTADIDTGGTFTDGLFTDGKEMKRVKVDTTPHDLTVAWMNCLTEGARQFGFSALNDFLEQVDIMRWTSTVATNVLAERKGPKLGLFVSEGYQKTLYSEGSQSAALGYLAEESNVEAVQSPINTEKLLLQIKPLLERGVRRICISLKDGLKHEDEVKMKEVFEEQYPDHYLGNVPLLLGRDVSRNHDDMTRTHMALMNSYVHGPMAMTMFKAEDELRARGFLKPLLVGHIDGGVARVSKTKPVDTIESGPIFGIHAGAYWAKLYELPYVITLDVGGTTTKIGLVENFRPAITRQPDILGIPLRQNMLDLRSIALGGGSVAKVNGKGLQLGPQSMGAYPGPACYDLGGAEATLTDAYVVKGFLDPSYFAGGAKRLNAKRAEKMIGDKVARQLGIEPQAAAYAISNLATDMIANELTQLIARTERSPGDYTLFAFGGNGGLVGCEAARKAEIHTVYVFSHGSVLSAFGSFVADISHSYEHSALTPVSKCETLAGSINWMAEEARLDMEGEGFGLADLKAELEFVLYDEKSPHNVIQVTSPWNLSAKVDKDTIMDCLNKADLGPKAAHLMTDIVRLRVWAPLSRLETPKFPSKGADPKGALKGEREVWRGTEKVTSKVLEWNKLRTGNVVQGPAAIEGTDATYIVPRGWQLVIDPFLNGVLTRRP